MFDSLPDVDSLTEADDTTLVTAIKGWGKAEAAASARRLAAIAELVSRRGDDAADNRALWSCDLWDATAAEVGAALNLSPRRASTQMNLAQSLRERLPRVAKLFLDGAVSARLVAVISWRTHLTVDTDAMDQIDTAIAEQATKWGPLSDAKLELTIDTLVEKHDPAAREWFREAARGRNIEFGKPDDATGTCSVWGRLYEIHAELFDRRLAALARGVCASDPRTVGQRRSDAIGAILAGTDRMACQCGSPECAQATDDSFAGSAVIHVIADQSAITAATDQEPSSGTPDAPHRGRPVAVMAGGSVLPNPLLAELIRGGAKLIPLRTPCTEAEARYRPSVGLQRFVRARDMTCRFVGCDKPAEFCDIDHTVPYPVGPTHPSNLKSLCRKHHLLKTFWGWKDEQLPDGAVVWTSPSGHRYKTRPGSRISFPDWDVRTAELAAPTDAARSVNRTLMMPTRRQTRAADRAQRIKARRATNDTS